eukprot:15343311-Ditylum_brightwellii.AAC.1
MLKVELLKATATEQFGSYNYHRAIEVVLNSWLVGDLLHVLQQAGIIVSNDAKSCFDHIINAVFKICLSCIGCHDEPIAVCIYVVQNVEHYIQAAFGNSSASYSGTPGNPLQGLVQGYGPALAGWAL